MAEYIHGTSAQEQARLAGLNRLTNASFVEFLKLRGDERVLEIGSGLGILAAEVAGRAREVVGLEHSAEQLAKAPSGVPRLRFARGDAHEPPFADGEFDLVYCRYLLEHVADPSRVLREARRVLRPGGRIAVQENDVSLVRHDPPAPAFDQVWARFAELQRRLGGDALIGRRLFGLLKGAGFASVRLSLAPELYASGDEHYATWLENLVANVEGARAGLVREGLATDGEIDGAIAELRQVEGEPLGSTLFAWNRAEAVKRR